MKDRGKALDTFNGEPSTEQPCMKHPSSGGGICAFCLREKLIELICHECGEQRLSSCSCSENSSDPNSNPENGSIGRISFLIENEKSDPPKIPKTETLNRSNSHVENRGGFWRIGRLFRKKSQQKNGILEDSRSEMWVSDIVGVPRSRSLCSFRGGVNGSGNGSFFYDTEGSSGVNHSAARVSSVSGGFMMDSAKRSCFSESEARMSNFEERISNFEYDKDVIGKGIFTMREGCEFSCGDDPKFIDLKLDLARSSEVRTEHSVLRRGSMRVNEYYGMMKNGGGGSSCRFSVSERELKKCRKSRKVWRWFFPASSRLG